MSKEKNLQIKNLLDLHGFLAEEIDKLAECLFKNYPYERRDGETAVDTAIRILELEKEMVKVYRTMKGGNNGR